MGGALPGEEFEGRVGGGRGGCGAFGAELVGQVVGADGCRAFEDEAEHLAAQGGEFATGARAEQAGVIEGRRGTGGKRGLHGCRSR